MNESNILVPVRLEALVLDEHTAGEENWKNFAFDYEGMKTRMGTQLETDDLMKLHKDLYDPGVHLHWALPDALTNGIYIKGKDEAEGKMVFPAVPNRWLVMRIQVSGDKPLTKKWIVESDHISDDSEVPWAVQQGNTFSDTRIGRAVELKDWNNESPRATTPLTAVAPGNPAFAALYQCSRSVFGFYDDMTGVKKGETFSYLVTGWYSDPAIDPLINAPDEIIANIKNKWSIQGQPEQALTGGIVCHGFIHAITWWDNDNSKRYALPVKDVAVNVGVGYTSVEAKTTQIASQTGAAEKLLSAFFYDTLKDIQGAVEIETQVNDRAFSHVDGGTLWDIHRTEDRETDKTKEGVQKPNFPDAVTEPELSGLFRKLNEEQRKLDRLLSERESLLITFRAICDKIIRAERKAMTEVIPRLESARKTVKNDIDTITTAIAIAYANIHGDAGRKIDGYVKTIRSLKSFSGTATVKPEFELAGKKPPRFWKPNDPVVVFSGPGVQPPLKYKKPGNTKKFTCRLPSQVSAYLVLKDGARDEQAVSPPPLDATITPRGSLTTAVIDVINKLFNETLLLDPAWAAEWVYKYYGGDRNNDNAKSLAANLQRYLDVDDEGATVNQLAVKCYNGELIAGISDRQKLLPFLGECGIQKWKHPWTPIYLVWYVKWLPSYKTAGGQKLFDKDQWVWKDKKYSYSGSMPDRKEKGFEYSGKAILTDAVTGILKAKLPDVATDHNISQALAFSNDLIMRMQAVQLPLLKYNKDEDILTKDTGYDPYLTRSEYFFPGVDAKDKDGNNFFPVRAGHMRIMRLWVTDAFGQVQKVLDSDNKRQEPAATGTMYTTSDMTVGADKELTGVSPRVALSPRIIQPARLSFRWMKAVGAVPEETTADPATSPVCGWLLPDALNRSLDIYDASGRNCGLLKMIGDTDNAGGIRLEWLSPPGSIGNKQPANSIQNNYLLGFVNGLLEQSKAGNGVVMKMLFKLCNDVAMFLNTSVTQQASGVAGLVGQPIALVRASLKFELQGLPVQPQGWEDSITPQSKINPPGLQGLEFPVSLGDTRNSKDGMIGYFTDKSGFSKMILAYGTPAQDNPYFVSSDTQLSFKTDEEPLGITILMDPRGGAQADCGILPSKFIDLPHSFTDTALENIELHLLVAPFLGAADNPYLPVSMEQDRNWQLLQKVQGKEEWKKTDIGDQNPMQANGFNTQTIQEGYLVLKPVEHKK